VPEFGHAFTLANGDIFVENKSAALPAQKKAFLSLSLSLSLFVLLSIGKSRISQKIESATVSIIQLFGVEIA
jgi:hypothetical protein